MNQSENRYYICKPSNRQWELFPVQILDLLLQRLPSDPLRFKIVRLSNGEYKDWEFDLEYSEPEFDGYEPSTLKFLIQIFGFGSN